jgi:hypothetical protein
VLKAMLLTKLKLATAVLLLAGVLGAGLGASGLARRAQAAEQADAAAKPHPPDKGQDKKPAPRRGEAVEDLLREAQARASIAEQRLALDVDDALRKARGRYAGRPAAALRLVRAALLRVLDDPDVGERAWNDLLARVVAGRRELTEAEKKPVWQLEFRFRDPRRLTTAGAGGARKTVWYCRYEVLNPTAEPHPFLPDLELEAAGKVYHDTVLPAAQAAVRRLEDPTGTLDLKNSVTIALDPIPPAKSAAGRKGASGVAFWEGVDPDAASFTVYVSGLTNAWSVEGESVRRKVLKLTFKRADGKMVFAGPAEWVYRAAAVEVQKRRLDELRRLLRRTGDGY